MPSVSAADGGEMTGHWSRLTTVSARFSWAIAVSAAVLIVPIWLAALPAMPDFPAHLATFYLLAHGAKELHASQFYRVEWAFVPNLAAELVVPALSTLMSVVAATKIFLSVVVAMWVFGAAAIHKALFGRIGAAPLAAGFFAYNANFMWGFLNYCFGMGLGFLALAAWIASDGKRGSWRIAGFTLLATAVYFCHLFAFATLMFLIICYEIGALWEQKDLSWRTVLARTAPVILIVIPAALAFLLLKPHAAGGGHLEFNLRSTLDDRADAAIQFSFDHPAQILVFILVLCFVIGVWMRKIVVHPRMTLLLALLGVAFIFTPEWAMGGWGVDLRLPAVLGVLAFASSSFKFGRRTAFAVLSIVLLAVIYQSATLAGNWRYYDRRISELRDAFSNLPAGSRLLTVLDGNAIGEASDQPYWHMAEYAIIDRGDFTPLLFATKGQHVIQLTPAVARIAAQTAEQGSPPDISQLDDLEGGDVLDDPDIAKTFPYLFGFQCHFDYAVVIHAGGTQTSPPDMLQRVHAGSFFSLYRILPADNCKRP